MLSNYIHVAGGLRQRAIEPLEFRPSRLQCVQVRSDGAPVAARDRPGQFEPVVDRPADQRKQRLRRSAGVREERSRRAMQGHEVIGGERRAGMIERALVVGEVERRESQQPGERVAVGAGVGALRRDRCVCAIQLLGTAATHERLQRMHAEPSAVRVESLQRRSAAHVRHPRPRLNRRGDIRDHGVGDAEQHEGGVRIDGQRAALAQTRGDRATGATQSDDANGLKR